MRLGCLLFLAGSAEVRGEVTRRIGIGDALVAETRAAEKNEEKAMTHRYSSAPSSHGDPEGTGHKGKLKFGFANKLIRSQTKLIRSQTKRIRMMNRQNTLGEKYDIYNRFCYVMVASYLLFVVVYVARDARKDGEYRMTAAKKLLIAFSIWLLVGVYFIHFNEGYQFNTSLYIIVQVLTTVGYGDIELTSDSSKLFMALYVMSGIVALSNFIPVVAELIQKHRENDVVEKMEKAGQAVGGDSEQTSSALMFSGELRNLLSTASTLVALIAFGTIYYGTFESCSCGFGRMKIEDCEPEKCEETGGTHKSYIDTFYMSCITLTTVGFGDFTPSTRVGRLLGTFWMLGGVISLGNFCSAFSKYFFDDKPAPKDSSQLAALLKEVDDDNDGALSKLEFIQFMLVQNGLVQKEILRELGNQYDKMDANQNGFVTIDEVVQLEAQVLGVKK